MKKIITLGIVCLTLAACTKKAEVPTENPTPPSNLPVELTDPNFSAEAIITNQEGSQCGGPDNILCAAPLFCQKEIETPDQFGFCVNTVVDASIVCGKEQAPVCGQNGHRKTTFLNACEAQRHGATIVNNGFCGRQNSFDKPCEAPVLSVGECQSYFTGFFFDGESCQEKPVMGCDIDAPFRDKASCEARCK